jgi:hypothetical protein
VIGGCAAWLWVRARGHRRVLLAALLPLLLCSAPWWVRALSGGEARRIVRVSAREESMGEHLREVLPRLHLPVAGLLGTHVPLVADDPEGLVIMPPLLAAAVVLGYGLALVLAARRLRASPAAALLALCAALAVLAFPFPLRAGPYGVRFLSLVWLPLAALVGRVAVFTESPRRTALVTLGFMALNLLGGTRLLAAWRSADRTQPPFLLVDLGPAQRLLDAHAIGHAYASYGPAWRLTWATRERIVATQPWNERFLHYPLPYLDEVRFAKDTAWVLTPSVPTDLPPPRRFEDLLTAAGGTWKREAAGAAVVYHGFQPPFGADGAPPPGAAAAGDRDPFTRMLPPPAEPVTFTLDAPQAVDAVTLVSSPSGPRLPRSCDVEVADAQGAFTVVAQRRRRGERDDLRWVNGQPQFVLDNDLLSVPLGGRVVSAVRIRPVASDEPWSLAEVLLHRAQPPAARAPWSEWLDPRLGWSQRRATLLARPLTARADWYARVLIAERQQ